MMTMSFFFIIIVTILPVLHAKRSSGLIHNTNTQFAFVDRFCFVSEAGTLQFKVQYPALIGQQSLLLYYDTADQWSRVYKTNLTCAEKVGVLDPANHQQIRLTPDGNDETTKCESSNLANGEPWITCTGNTHFVSRRSRWWFLAVANCNPNRNVTNVWGTGVYLDYQLLMTNGDPSDFWTYHFSADQFFLLPFDILFLALDGIVLLIAIVNSVILHSRHLLHSTVKLYLECLLLEVLSLTFSICALIAYARDGVERPALRGLGQFFGAFAYIAFIYLLLLLAQGYTITRGQLSKKGTIRQTVITVAFTVTYAAMLIVAHKAFDPGLVMYISESAPGTVLMGLQLIAWLCFVVSVTRTVHKYATKRGFYYIFTLLFTIWFWMGPVSILIANYLLDNWVREEVVAAVDNGVHFWGFCVFLVLTWHSATNRNFPFHVRTSQVAVVDLANYPVNRYEVTREQAAALEMPKIGHRPIDRHTVPQQSQKENLQNLAETLANPSGRNSYAHFQVKPPPKLGPNAFNDAASATDIAVANALPPAPLDQVSEGFHSAESSEHGREIAATATAPTPSAPPLQEETEEKNVERGATYKMTEDAVDRTGKEGKKIE